MSPLETVLFALFGAVAVQLLDVAEYRRLPEDVRPQLRDPFYWAQLAVYPLLGAGLAFAYVRGGQPPTPILAIQIGASAPLLIRAMVAAAARPDVPKPRRRAQRRAEQPPPPPTAPPT